MKYLHTTNAGGLDYGYNSPGAFMGSCATPAGTEVKVCTFDDDFELIKGDMIAIKFTYANTYGDGSTLYPKISIGGHNYPLKLLVGAYAASGAWADGQTVIMLFDGESMLKVI